MLVTRFGYYMEKNLIEKIDLMIKRVVQKNPKNDNILLVEAPERTGKCQKKGTKILMADGSWKNIEEIKEGDLVISPQYDGSHTFSKVTGLCNWFCNDVYDVVQLNKNKKKLYTCSGNHPIPLNVKVRGREKLTNEERLLSKEQRFELFKHKKRNKGEWRIKHYDASEFYKMGKTFKTNTTSLSSFRIDKFMDRENCKIEPYTLGVYLGDGSFSSIQRGNSKRRKVCISHSNLDVIEEILKHYIGKRINSKTRKALQFFFSLNGELSKQLIEYDLEGKGSGDKFIPPEALLSDADYRIKLLAGLIDTDCYYSNGGYQFTSKSKQLIENIKSLVYSLGGRTGEIIEKKKGIKSSKFIGTYFNITAYLGNLNIPIKKKYKINNKNNFYISSNRLSIDVKKSEPCQVYGFSIDSSSKWYVTDNWMITHNTTLSVAVAYYVSEQTGRKFDNTHVFFDLQKMISYLKDTDGEIAIWDEPALQALSGDFASAIVKDLTRLLMMCGKKRHFLIINMTYFNKFNDYIAWQRPVGMIHLYSREDLKAPRFVYIRKKNLELLWNEWKTKKKRSYKKYSSKRVRGTFGDVLNPDYRSNVLSEFDVQAYERAKDEAISSIGSNKLNQKDLKFLILKYCITKIPFPQKDLLKYLHISKETFSNWSNIPQEYPQVLGKIDYFEAKRSKTYYKGNEMENFDVEMSNNIEKNGVQEDEKPKFE